MTTSHDLASFTIPGNGDYPGYPDTPRPLSEEDRAHGYLVLQAISNWDYWVKRRVDTVSLLSNTLAERRHSVDFRVRDWFPDSAVRLGEHAYYYVPLMLLAKYDIPGLDIRDESGRAIPLLTRKKSAAIAASALTAMALTSLVDQIKTTADAGVLPTEDIKRLRTPPELESRLYAICYAAPDGEHSAGDGLSAYELFDQLVEDLDDGMTVRPASQWKWTQNAGTWESDATVDDWLVHLAVDEVFTDMLLDFVELFLVLVPVKEDPNARRIMEVSYRTHLTVPRLASTAWIRERMHPRAVNVFAAAKDSLEGILPEPGDDWKVNAPCDVESTSLGTKAAAAVGWIPKDVRFELGTSPGHGGSYHFEFQAPPGLQIRQATLRAETDNQTYVRTQMGAQTLRHTHLYLTNLPQVARGEVSVQLKVSPTTLVRGAWFAALLSLVLLFLGYVKLDVVVDPDEGSLGPTLAIFLLLPGLIAGLLTRGEEHPMTTDLLFGLRCLCGLVAALPLTAAFLVLAFRSQPFFFQAWQALLAVSVWTCVILTVTWWLAARRRPSGSAP